MRRNITGLVAVVALMVGSVQGLKVGFYNSTACSRVEDVVRAEVEKEFAVNPSIVALLLRMYFHDCFANSKCDASLLITKNKGAIANLLQTELSAGPNQGIRRLDFIDTLKKIVVNTACVGNKDLVSCADIIALATRDAVSLASNRGPYAIPTGRLDALESLVAMGNLLPGPDDPIPVIVGQFLSRGFTEKETVILSAAHTVGQARCSFVKPDKAENNTTRTALQNACAPTKADEPGPGGEKRANLDQGPNSANIVDKSYLVMVKLGSGVLQSDRGLRNDTMTSAFVTQLAEGSNDEFLKLFEAALIKLGNLGSSETWGDIRKVCSVLN